MLDDLPVSAIQHSAFNIPHSKTTHAMKTKLFLLGALALGLFACTSKPEAKTFKVNVNLANADGKTVYLQKDGQTLDSAVIANWDAVFNTPVCDDNEMYSIMLKGWHGKPHRLRHTTTTRCSLSRAIRWKQTTRRVRLNIS